MRICKIALLGLSLLMAVACGGNRQDKELIVELKSELARTKQDQAVLESQYIQQNEDLSAILEQISAISGRTTKLRLDVETGSAKLTQAQNIEDRIYDVRKRIDELQRANAALRNKNKEFEKVIESFKTLIDEKEQEIEGLKEEIQAKDVKIASQQNTINLQSMTILQQNQSLEAQVLEQAKLLFEAGAYLEKLADNAPNVSWNSNKKKLEAMTQDIYRQALSYYTKALETGYEEASAAIESVKAKIK